MSTATSALVAAALVGAAMSEITRPPSDHDETDPEDESGRSWSRDTPEMIFLRDLDPEEIAAYREFTTERTGFDGESVFLLDELGYYDD
jgi:hypothetical protein